MSGIDRQKLLSASQNLGPGLFSYMRVCEGQSSALEGAPDKNGISIRLSPVGIVLERSFFVVSRDDKNLPNGVGCKGHIAAVQTHQTQGV